MLVNTALRSFMFKKLVLLFSILLICLASPGYAKETNSMNDYWHSKWETNDTKWDQQEPNPLLVEYLNHLDLKPGARIFVPLSGKSIDMLWLAKQGYQVVGVELSLKACELFFKDHNIAYEKSKEGNFDVLNSEKISLLAGDFFDLTQNQLGKVDAVYDRAALIALSYEKQSAYAKHLQQLIKPHTPIMLITFSYNPQEMQGPPYAVSEKDVTTLFGSHISSTVLSNKAVMNIPAHLQAKGLTQVNELVFVLYSET